MIDAHPAQGGGAPIIGWREWVALPGLRVPSVKAKVDTGARSSSLHAFALKEFRRGRRELVSFSLHPEQRSARHAQDVTLPVVDHRRVRSSNGQLEQRPVVQIEVELLGRRWDVEFTLTNRDEMGFRMLLGRTALRGRFLVDPGRSFLGGRRVKGTRRIAAARRRPRRSSSKGSRS